MSKNKNEFSWHSEDNLLHGFSYQDLIDMVYSNEKIVDEESVTRCFNDILDSNTNEARHSLKSHMEKIVEAAKRDKN